MPAGSCHPRCWPKEPETQPEGAAFMDLSGMMACHFLVDYFSQLNSGDSLTRETRSISLNIALINDIQLFNPLVPVT